MNHPLLNIAIQAGRSAGRIISRSLDHLDANNISLKQKHDFVTNVDLAAEEEIVRIIQEAYPDHAILAEESGSNNNKSEFEWVIDPLDGTLNFIHGIPHFAISIAVLKRQQLEIGMIFDPIKNELFTAVKGGGAQFNNRKMRVSECKKLDEALLVTGLPFREEQPLAHYLKSFSEILPQVAGIRRPGAASLDLAYVACGRFDGYWEMGLKPWDMAAGILLVKEAGGIVTDLAGQENYLENGNVLAANLALHKTLGLFFN